MTMLDLIRTSIAEVRPDIDTEWLGAETLMRGDLSMTSIDLINTLALITQAIGQKIMYEPLLLPGGTPRPDLTLGELADFIETRADAPAPNVVAM